MGRRQGLALRAGVTAALAALACLAAVLAQHVPHAQPQAGPPPLPAREGPLRKAQILLREGKTEEARRELQRLIQSGRNDAMTWYQLARSYLLDFYAGTGYAKRRTSLNLAMEALGTALKRDPDHIPSLKAKAVIHARAELLYYDPNLAYELAARVAKLGPNAYGFLLNLSDWMSGEVRFSQDTGHRVPHDPLLGLDRSIDLREQGSEGFGATSQKRQHFGIGARKKIDSLEIRWPGGAEQKIEALEAGQIIEVEEGRGWRRVK